MKNVDEFLTIINLCNDEELEILTSRCNELSKERKTAARNALRIKLMENLQNVLSDILKNGFDLTITNTYRSSYDDHKDVWFSPDDTYSIEIEQ